MSIHERGLTGDMKETKLSKEIQDKVVFVPKNTTTTNEDKYIISNETSKQTHDIKVHERDK